MSEEAPLFVLGLGPGSPAFLTPEALAAIEQARCIVGYQSYIDLLAPELKADKRIVANGMRQERERCQAAIDAALGGECTAVICSGDPGIYAMASLVLELMEVRNLRHLPLQIIPGVPAFCAAAAVLGAPIGHDFASVSLSDLLTPLPLILRRLKAAFAVDFVVILYNPRSRGRQDHLAQALDIARQYRSPHCPVGLVRNVGRPQAHVRVSRLDQFRCEEVDMLSLVIVGNSQSRRWDRYMITPRGYAGKA